MGSDPRSVRIFGLNLRTDFDFDTPLPPGGSEPELSFRCVRGPAPDASSADGPAAFESPVTLQSGAPFLAIHPGVERDLLRFSEVADFLVTDDEITCHLLDPDYAFMVEIHLLGMVFSYWFERRGIPMIHASAVVVGDRAAVFMASNRGGKSSLAASLVQSGCPLLTDDLLGLQQGPGSLEGRPGYPCMRFWPDQAAQFWEAWDDLPLAHPRYSKRRLPVGEGGLGTFWDRPTPVACFYLPERQADPRGEREIQISPVPPSQGIVELVRRSFLPQVVEAVGFASRRLRFFGRVVSDVPVRRLVYPEGNEHLPQVRDVILEDLQGVGRGPAVERG
jgi:hypothetical protein